MSKQEPTKNQKPIKLFPSAGQLVFFVAAIVNARSIEKKKDKAIKGSSSHRTQMAKVEDGYLFIDQEWHVKT
jgi:hypothetical protein